MFAEFRKSCQRAVSKKMTANLKLRLSPTIKLASMLKTCRLSRVFLSRLRGRLLIGCCGGWLSVDGRIQEGYIIFNPADAFHIVKKGRFTCQLCCRSRQLVEFKMHDTA
ncbi:hypothetical protein NPIL_140061 [Nephila pilipes]|uniref:Uncharacterized protein n=1 Tax=Nephila pilipes TaxID=299642 RepID=A0A8X6QJG6_NEPPI|nr:hypothetical protein NPIL_140061 [Nephila pilipes]